MNKRTLTLATVAVLALFALVPPISADSITFNITVPNAAVSGYAGPYATVLVNSTNATTATIIFTSLTQSGDIYLMGGTGAVAVNVNATSWALGAITGSNAGTGFTPGPYSNGGSGSEDGFGVFNQQITSFDGYTHSSDTVSFAITNTSGTWASASDVLTASANGYLAGMHVFVTSDPANGSNGALVTGYAVNGPAPTPEPGMLTMLFAGLLPLGGFLSKLRRA
jgi:hypothetical protein